MKDTLIFYLRGDIHWELYKLPFQHMKLTSILTQKEEVFLHPRIIEQAITQSVTQSLEKQLPHNYKTNTSSPTIEPSSAQWYAQQSTYINMVSKTKCYTIVTRNHFLHTNENMIKQTTKYNLQNISSYSGSSAHRHTEKFILK